MNNIGIIVAHVDDETISMGGAIKRFVAEGKTVSILFTSKSSYRDFNGQSHRTEEQVEDEMYAVMRYLGVGRFETLSFETKCVPYSSMLIEGITEFITHHKIDTVFTHAPDDYHSDHQHTGKAVLAAARRVNNIYLFEPMFPAKSMTLFQPNFYIDINGYMPNKLEALKLHRSQYEKYGEKWLEIATSLARVRGLEIDKEYAEAFCVIKQTMDYKGI